MRLNQDRVASLKQQLEALNEKHEGHGFGEAFIHQMIETIEFFLGTISNTASYLRLWALSLAHSKLTETFTSLTLGLGGRVFFTSDSIVTTLLVGIILWPIFWSVNLCVLMLMDNLECTLHTLRLHWVEFQNKFYKGDGYPFAPFSY